jgi:hypothetical protein
VQELASEFPELRERLPEVRKQVAALRRYERYQLSLYRREITPRSFARFDRWSEFRVMQRAIPDYLFSPLETVGMRARWFVERQALRRSCWAVTSVAPSAIIQFRRATTW